MKKLLAVLAFAGVTLAVAPASAEGTTGVGWWTRSPIASAPEGGFTVGNAPDGPLSVAAVGVDLGKGVSSAQLSFEQAGGAAPGPGQLVACVIGSFESVAGGTLEEAPTTTCDGTSAAVAVNGTTWTVNLTDLVGDSQGSAGIALVPATGSTGVWDLQLDTPTFTSTAASGTGGPSSSPTGSAGSPFQSTVTTTASRPTTSPTFSVAKPPTVGAPNAAAAASTTVAPTTTAVANLTASAQQTFSGSAGGGGGDTGRPVGQAITLVLVAAVVGVAGGVVHKVGGKRFAA